MGLIIFILHFYLKHTLRDVLFYKKSRKDDVMFFIGELSKQTGVTVRTLDYYDEINLITPSSKTSGGHRLYDDGDVMKLQQVLALKYMGFSLEQIKARLNDSMKTWHQSINEQIDMVHQEQERLNLLEKALLGILYSIEFEGDMDWSVVFGIIQLFQKGPEYTFQAHAEHFTPEGIQKMMQFNNKMSEEDIKEWVSSIQAIKANININPASKKALTLVEQWMTLADNIFDHDKEFLGNMWQSMESKENADNESIAFYPLDKKFIEFIKAVYIAHNQGE